MKVDAMKELRTMRTRFVNCAIHNGSDREFAEAACESFDAAMSAIADLIAATWRSELLLRDMAEAGFGDHGPADDLRAALEKVTP